MKKITRRSFLAAAGVSAAALALTACGGSSNSAAASTSTAASSTAASAAGDATAAANDPKVTLVYAEVNPLDTIVGQTATHFKEKVEELTGGSVVIDVQASGVLGSENDVLDAILGGSTSIDMSRISAFALTSYGCNKSKLLSIPFTFENRAHFWNFANSDLAPEFLNEPQELGLPVRGVFYGEEGFRHFFTVNPVSGIDDFKGLKLRVSNDPVMNGLVEGLGANPTVVSFGELYSALQTGVVDGAEQPIANYKSNAFPEVANNLILDGHTLGAIQAVITDNAWAKLTENQQVCKREELQHRVTQGLFAGPEGRTEGWDEADRHTGSVGRVQRREVGEAAGAVYEAGAGKGQRPGVCGPALSQLPGRVEQVGRADAAGQRPSAAPEEERRGGAGGEAEAADVHAGVGQSVCDAVPEGILPQLAQKGSSAAQRRIGQRQRGGTAAHPGPERLRRRERGRAFQLKPRLAETI